MTALKKIIDLLTSAQRKKGLLLFCLMVVGMALEMMGIGLVIPVMGLMVRGDYLDHYQHLVAVAQHLGLHGHAQLVCLIMITLLCAYVLKNVYLGILAWCQTRFASDVQIKLSQRLFAIYLAQPYAFHLQRNSAQLLRNVIGEVNVFSGAISHVLQIAAEGLVMLGVGLLLLYMEPKGALVIIVATGAVGWGLLRSVRKFNVKWGRARQLHDGLRIQFLQEGIGGVKDVKLLGREQVFLAKHAEHNILSARAGELQTTFQQVPRLVLELLAILGFVLLVISMVSQGKSMDTIMPALGLFAAAAFRLMPSASRILSSLQTLRFSFPAIDTLHEEIVLEKCVTPSGGSHQGIRFANELRLINVDYQYEAGGVPALRSVSLAVRCGETIGIVGTSGSGKSTLVDIILGLLTPVAGRVEVDGENIAHDMRDWQDRIGYVAQTIFLIDDTLRRNIAFGLPDDQIDEQAVLRAVKAAQLQDFVAGLPIGLETVVGERGVRLSGGQRQRIGIARALYHDPDVLVLDEATSALDGATENGIMQAVRAMQGSKTILIVAHRLTTVAHCDRIYRFEQGRLAAVGTPTEMLDPGKITQAN